MSYSLTTPRTILRSAIKSDAAFLLQLHSDPADAEMRVFRDPAQSLAAFEQRTVEWASAAAEGKNRFMVIVVKPSSPGFDSIDCPVSHDGKLVGMTGFNTIEYSPGQEAPHIDRGAKIEEIDLGVHTLPGAAGWGWGREALAAVTDHAFELGSKRVLMETMAVNTKFIAFCAKIGLEKYSRSRMDEKHGEERIYQFDRAAWKEAKRNWPVHVAVRKT
ncbi:hypothetical protein MBLNU457_3245t1 [Dothideomycetes sp. NU457]